MRRISFFVLALLAQSVVGLAQTQSFGPAPASSDPQQASASAIKPQAESAKPEGRRRDECSREFLEELEKRDLQAYRRRAVICEVNKSAGWYEWWSNFYQYIWNGSTVAIIVLTALTSLFAALDFGQTRRGKITLVALPAIASLLTALLTQFSVRDLWKLREMGRLDVIAIKIDAQALSAENNPKLREEVKKIRMRVLEIDRSQASRFFDYVSGQREAREREEAAREAAGRSPPAAPASESVLPSQP